MGGLFPWPGVSGFSFSGSSFWGILLVFAYPALTVGALECARVLGRRFPLASDILRQTAFLLLPTGAVWLLLTVVAELPAENRGVRAAETAFALTALYLLLRLAQAALMRLIGDEMQAPKLLLDILRIGLSLVWGAVVVSRIWDVDLGGLLAAMGVGSIVLGFALQEFLGNLLSGLGLLSAHKFGIGDWIVVDGAPAKVVEMDWRTVTLTKGGADRLVVANSTLAKGNLVIAARAGQRATVTVPLSFGVEIPPEQVREAVLEAGRALPDLAGVPDCVLTGITDGLVTYSAILPVANPGVLSGPRDAFLSRFWYVAQRRGIRLEGATESPPDGDARLAMLRSAGAFHGDAAALPRLAHSGAFRRYRRGDVLLQAGAVAAEAFLVLAGDLAVGLASGDAEIRLELVGPAQLLVLRETLACSASPVRVYADSDADVLAIPAAALLAVMEGNRVIARDVGALAEARRLAIRPLDRGLSAAA